MTTEDDLIEAARLASEIGSGIDLASVELCDENDPDGLVVFKNKDGQPVMWMPRADYEAFRKGAP